MGEVGQLLTVDAARAVVRAEKEDRRTALKAVVDRNPNGGLAGQATLLLLDYRRLDEKIEEATPEGGTREQGKEQLVFMICAQVSSGTTLNGWCEAQGLDRGVVRALLGENDEWVKRYRRAQAWQADSDVAETVPIADESADPKLRIDTRFRRAKLYDPEHFGVVPGPGVTVNVPPPAVGDVTELARRVAFLLRKGVEEAAAKAEAADVSDVSDAVIVDGV